LIVSAIQRARNDELRDIRIALNMSQSEFATAKHQTSAALGESNAWIKYLVQK